MKKVLSIIAGIIFMAGIAYLVLLTNREHRRGICSGLSIELQVDGQKDSLITTAQVLNLVTNNFDTLTKRPLSNISTASIEQTLKSSPFIREADVLVTMNRKLKVRVRTYSPVVRLITGKNKSFYLDKSGYIVPVNPQHPSYVLLASGHINLSLPDSAILKNLHYKKLNNFSVIGEIFNLAKQIRANRFLKAQVEQIYRNSENEYELIPKIGDQLIIFGSASLIDKKLKKLEAIYKQAIPKSGWKTYDAINLKYKNQVVCSK